MFSKAGITEDAGVDDAQCDDRDQGDVIQKATELLTAEFRAERERVLALVHAESVEFGAPGLS